MHPDTIAFLALIRRLFDPDRIILAGDEVDYHSISFHNHDPDLLSPSEELKLAIKRLKPIYGLFPKADVLESNHGSLVYRKGKFHGLPRSLFKSYREVLEAPKGWRWHYDLTLELPNGQSCYFHHGKSGHYGSLSKTMGMNAAQGHFHEKMHITYWANPNGIFWDLHAGCLINYKDLAFDYGKNNLHKPLIGCAVIIDSVPRILPMVLNAKGRWIRKIV